MKAKTADSTEGSTALRPAFTEPATQSVLARLREMIVTGVIEQGSRLRAEALAARLDVSRTPVRSALAVLATEGLVTYSVNRGYTVQSITIREVFDAIEVRAGLEAQACRLSVEYGWNHDEIAMLENIALKGRRIVDAGKWSARLEQHWYQHNVDFHRTIGKAADNTVLRNAIRITIIYPILGDAARICPAIAAHIPERLRQLPDTVPAHVAESQQAHEAILAVIRAGDADHAAALMSAHVLQTKIRINAIATRRKPKGAGIA